METSARATADFVRGLDEARPELAVGDIEPCPHDSVAELRDWVLEPEANGVRPAFSHVDIHRVRVEGQDLAGDLAELTRFSTTRTSPSAHHRVGGRRRRPSAPGSQPESLAGTNGSPMSQSRALTPRLHGPS